MKCGKPVEEKAPAIIPAPAAVPKPEVAKTPDTDTAPASKEPEVNPAAAPPAATAADPAVDPAVNPATTESAGERPAKPAKDRKPVILGLIAALAAFIMVVCIGALILRSVQSSNVTGSGNSLTQMIEQADINVEYISE